MENKNGPKSPFLEEFCFEIARFRLGIGFSIYQNIEGFPKNIYTFLSDL
jgi:hypothetical protein